MSKSRTRRKTKNRKGQTKTLTLARKTLLLHGKGVAITYFTFVSSFQVRKIVRNVRIKIRAQEKQFQTLREKPVVSPSRFHATWKLMFNGLGI